jgi:hypothetical protein
MHAPERNRKMNELRKAENDKRNRQRVEPKPYFPVDGLSGMTDAEARSVINTFKEMGIASKLEEHRISLQKISKATLLFRDYYLKKNTMRSGVLMNIMFH